MAGVVLTARHPGLIALLPAGIVGIVLGWFISTGSWQQFGIWTVPSVIGWTTGFADLANQTATADCIAEGLDVASCDPYGRPYTPYAVLPGRMLAFFGLGLAQTGSLGIALAGLYVSVVWLLGRTITRGWSRKASGLVVMLALLTAGALTPTALLLVERGQLDIIILALSASGLAAFSLHTKAAQIARPLGALALALSVIVKYFNIGAFAAFLTRRRWSWWAFTAFVVSMIFLAFNFTELQTTQSTAGADGPKTGRVMFGASTLLVTLSVEDPLAFAPAPDQQVPTALFTIMGIVILGLFTLGWWWWFRIVDMEEAPGVAWYWIVGSAGSVGLPYVLGPSNDYRLILLLPLFAATAAWWGRGGPSGPLVTVSALVIVALATNAWMIPNPSGWVMPEAAIIAGELAISATLGFGLALLTRAWTHGHAREQASGLV